LTKVTSLQYCQQTAIKRDPSRNFKKINLAKSNIRQIFGLAIFCREFEFLAKLRLTKKISATIQIILNNIKTDIAHCWCSSCRL